MLVAAGVPTNLTGVFPGADPSLVAMSVYDDSGVNPVLLLSPFLMKPVAGGCYVAKFTPANAKLYVAFLAVYEDTGFTVLDDAFALYQQSYAISAQFLTPEGQQVVGQIGGDAACGTPFSIFLGNETVLYAKALQAKCSGGDPLDLTYCTEIDVQLANQDGTITHLLLSTGGVVITPPAVLGKFTAAISSEVSALLNVGALQSFDVTFTILGTVFTVRYFQGLSVFQVR